MMKAWQEALHKSDRCDIIFSLMEEKIYAHSFILRLASNYFNECFNQSKEAAKHEYCLDAHHHLTSIAFTSVLEYLYLGTIEKIDALSLEDLYGMLIYASMIRKSKLEKICVNSIQVIATEKQKEDFIVNIRTNPSHLFLNVVLEWVEIDWELEQLFSQSLKEMSAEQFKTLWETCFKSPAFPHCKEIVRNYQFIQYPKLTLEEPKSK
jgi:HD superfamily phosphohydrolase